MEGLRDGRLDEWLDGWRLAGWMDGRSFDSLQFSQHYVLYDLNIHMALVNN